MRNSLRLLSLGFLAPAAGLLSLAVGTVAHAASSGYHQIAKYSLPGDGGWDYIKFDSATHSLFISRGTHVMVMDADNGKMIGDIPGTSGVHGIAINPDLHKGYTSNGRSNSVTVFNTKTLKVLKQIPIKGQGPDCIIFDPSTARVFTMNGESSDATAIDTATDKVVGTVKLAGRPEFAAADGKGKVYVNLEDKSMIQPIDAQALTVSDPYTLAPGEGPSGLAFDAVNRRLFSVCDNGKMVVTDPDSGKIVATPVIGNGPDASGFDPGLGYAFSSNGEDGTLSIVHEDSPSKFALVDVIPTQAGARTMAVDPASHKIFLVTAKSIPSTTERWRRSYVPGTFVVLVYGQ